MRASLAVLCTVALGLLAGCHFHTPAPPSRQVTPSVGPVTVELSLTRAMRIEPDLSKLAKTPIRSVGAMAEAEYRELTESACQKLAAKNTPPANALDEEGRAPTGCVSKSDELKQTVRFYTALELRNRAAADALDRYFQLANSEAGTDLLRQSFPTLDDLIAKSKAAQAANVRFPLEPSDLVRQRGQLLSQLEQAEAASDLLNIDLKRRLGLPPDGSHLWPSGDFAIDTSPADAEASVNAALADRPELRALRVTYANLSADTLDVAREQLRTSNPLLGAAPPLRRGLAAFVLKHRGPDPATLAELEVRKKQLAELISARERDIADETRAAVVTLNAQTRRAQLARDRFDAWTAKLAEAKKKREANQPGAELLEAQITLDWLKAKAEAISEVIAWHQARIKLKAAQGWLAWEGLAEK